jgi:hypothetical protein
LPSLFSKPVGLRERLNLCEFVAESANASEEPSRRMPKILVPDGKVDDPQMQMENSI